MGLWGKIKQGVKGDTFKRATTGSLFGVDPVIGAVAGNNKRDRSAAGPATPAPQYTNNVNSSQSSQANPAFSPFNPYGTQQSLGKGAPPQAQGPAAGAPSQMVGKGTPPSASMGGGGGGGGGSTTQQMQAPAKGQ